MMDVLSVESFKAFCTTPFCALAFSKGTVSHMPQLPRGSGNSSRTPRTPIHHLNQIQYLNCCLLSGFLNFQRAVLDAHSFVVLLSPCCWICCRCLSYLGTAQSMTCSFSTYYREFADLQQDGDRISGVPSICVWERTCVSGHVCHGRLKLLEESTIVATRIKTHAAVLSAVCMPSFVHSFFRSLHLH